MLDLNKHIYTNDHSKPFHSSGFAKVANSNQLGATSGESFNQRQQIEKNRQIIGGYQRSAIGNSYGVLRAKQVVKRPDINRFKIPQRPTLQQHNSMNSVPRKQFVEPQSRNYNPFA